MSAPRVIKIEPTYGIAFWENVVIADIQGEVDASAVRGISEAYHALFEAYPDGIVGVTVLRATLSVGTAETNAEAKRVMEELRAKVTHIAIVIESQGFVAQLLRTIVRTLNGVARSSRLTLAPDLADAARMVAPHVVGDRLGSESQIRRDLLEAVAVVRRALSSAE